MKTLLMALAAVTAFATVDMAPAHAAQNTINARRTVCRVVRGPLGRVRRRVCRTYYGIEAKALNASQDLAPGESIESDVFTPAQ